MTLWCTFFIQTYFDDLFQTFRHGRHLPKAHLGTKKKIEKSPFSSYGTFIENFNFLELVEFESILAAVVFLASPNFDTNWLMVKTE